MKKIILIGEIVFIMVLLALSFGKRKEYVIDSNQFNIFDVDDSETEECEIMNYSMELPMGAYEISVCYTAEKYDDTEETTDKRQSAGKITFTGGHDDFNADDITNLLEDENVSSTRLWVRTFGKIDDFTIHVMDNRTGELSVNRIVIRESMRYRVVRVLKFILVFIIFDFVYLLIFDNSVLKINEKKIKVIIGLIGITFFSSLISFVNYLYMGHDMDFQLQRIVQLSYALSNGDIPQRISFSALNGYGYATPLFYGEVLLTVPAALYNWYVPLQTCYQIYVVLINLGTAVISYWCFNKMSASHKYSLITAFAYTCAAYRLSNIWLRCAVGEYSAMMFLPLIVYGFWYVYTRPADKKFTLTELLPLIVGFTGIIQTHILTCEMVVEFAVLFALIFFRKTFKKNRFVALLKSAVCVLILNLWFIIPFLQSMSMEVNVNCNDPWYIKDKGAYLIQLFSLIHTATGASIDGTAVGDMPFSIGAMLVFALVILVICCIKKSSWGLAEEKQFKEAKVFAGFGLLAVFMASYYFPWNFLQDLSDGLKRLFGVVQFPWRYLAIAVCILSFMLLRLLEILDGKISKSIMQTVVIVMLSATVLVESYSMTQFADTRGYMRAYTENNLSEMWVMSGEYMLHNSNWSLWLDKNVYVEGDVTINDYTDNGSIKKVNCVVNGDGSNRIILPMWAYDNYHAYTEDGNELTTGIYDDGRLFIEVDGKYDGIISVQYIEPVLWKVCNWISLLAVIALLAYVIRYLTTSSDTVRRR
jgi:hypothetical protein